MTLRECFLTENTSFVQEKKIDGNPVGILVHSTGANNPSIKRYVQPSVDNPNYDEILSDLGRNKYGNDWNHPIHYLYVDGAETIGYKDNSRKVKEVDFDKSVHAFIGKLADGKTIATYQTLPYDICCWGCSSGKKGSFNYNPTAYIQFEICEDNRDDQEYFDAAFTEAIQYCVHLCQKFGLTASNIVSHKEAHELGYASDHGDPHKWLKAFGKDMNWFRAEVDKRLSALTFVPSPNLPDTEPKPEDDKTPEEEIKTEPTPEIEEEAKEEATPVIKTEEKPIEKNVFSVILRLIVNILKLIFTKKN